MNNLSKYIVFVVLLVTWYSCQTTREPGESDLVLTGQIQNAADTILLLEELTPSELVPVDTIFVDSDGNFTFSKPIEDAGFYRITANPANFITLSVEPGERITIKADIENMPASYEVSGSPGSYIIWEINKEKDRGMKIADSLRVLYREHRGTPEFPKKREELRAEYRNIKDQQREFVMKVIDENLTSLASVLALYQYFENHMLLKESENFEYFEKLSKSLCDVYPSNKHVIDLKKRVHDHKREEQQRLINEKNLAIGSTAPEIVLPDTEGNPLALSSLHGNVVLIDFWAAWCPPCRESNIRLGELYKKYRDQGFEIYGVSLDRTRDQWLNAIEKDNITWYQVSDLRFMNSPVVNLYNFSEIPHTVLIDREGRIIARNFSVDELENLLLANL
ncbi:MAG: AhpC/TSA family protein [Bacteroidales bacterium]|nr:AhpC/TSA family protein [Bacteroidales bacterium]